MSDSDSNLNNKSRYSLLKHESRLKISLLWFLITSSQFPFSEKGPSIPFCDGLLARLLYSPISSSLTFYSCPECAGSNTCVILSLIYSSMEGLILDILLSKREMHYFRESSLYFPGHDRKVLIVASQSLRQIPLGTNSIYDLFLAIIQNSANGLGQLGRT
jgi:hypothetical protein